MSEENLSANNSYLSFHLGKEVFAVSVNKVLEVLEKQSITEVPKMPEYIRGVINFRGDILPVLETRVKFNMPIRDENKKYVIIVLDLQFKDRTVALGAIADSVRDVLEIKEEDIKPVPELGSEYNTEFLKGMIKNDERFLMILDIDKVFEMEDLKMAESIAEAVQAVEQEA
jgi:purine-binding chemotaxis protein CheW